MIPIPTALPIKAGIVGSILFGAWLYHSGAVWEARREGRAETQKRWDTEKLRARAVEDFERERRRLRDLRDAEFITRLTEGHKNALLDLSVASAGRADVISQLRKLAAAPARPARALDPGAACPAHAERVEELRGLLDEGKKLAGEVGELVNAGADKLGEVATSQAGLQRYVTEAIGATR